MATYIGDMLILIDNVEEGLKILGRVLELELKLKLEKCSILQGKIQYLGHEIYGDGI